MKKIWLPIITLVAVIAIVAGAYSSYQMQQVRKNYAERLQTATVLPQPRAISSFNLLDNKNQTYTNQNLVGHWTMFFFGFTNCGYICPTTMAALKSMTSMLQQENIAAPQVILVSVDPERDTLTQLNTYVTAFNPAFIGLTGSQDSVDALAKDLSVLYIKLQPKTSEETYDIDHSGAILLINPKGQLTAIFSMPHQPEQMAHDFALIEKYAG